MTALRYTLHGFDFGAAHVEATTDIDGRVVVTLYTDFGKRVEVYVSPKGRFVSVRNRGVGPVSGVDA